MRFVSVGLIPLLMASCAAKYRPTDPVLSDWERSIKFPVEKPHENLVYSGRQAGTQAPVIPLLAFGAAFDLDLVVMPKEGDYDMLEFARISQPSGPTWMVLETSQSGEQTMVANLDDIASVMPEIPLARTKGDLVVTDKTTEFTVDVSATYTNGKGQKVEAVFQGDPPTKTAKHRNGQTFDHSANQLMAVLDIPSTESLFKADVSIDGKNVKFKKIAGIVPGQFAMMQVQGGFGVGSYNIVPGDLGSGGSDWSKVVVNKAGTESTVKASPDMLLKMGVAQNASTVTKCWRDRFEAKKDLKGGRMAYDFTLAGGKVTEAKPAALTGTDVFADDELGKCVAAALTGWSLDPSLSGKVNWPFTFVPGDAEADTEPTVTLGMGTSELQGPPAEVADAGTGDSATDGASTPAPDAPIYAFTTVHSAPDGSSYELKWSATRNGDRVTVTQATDQRTLNYHYRLVQGSFLELYSITVEQYGRATPTAAVTFSPPIPDLRWAFSGKRASTFIIDVNGQENYAYGEAEAYWTEAGPKLKVTGTAPDWVQKRPMLSSISYSPDGTATVKVERVGE
jgi:hypothetical protein